MIIKEKVVNKNINRFENFVTIIIGKRRVNSTSKIIKITVIKKNCKEKGIRAEFLGSNPHSKGLFFSRSENVFLEIKFSIKIKIIKIIRIKFLVYNIILIIYTKF